MLSKHLKKVIYLIVLIAFSWASAGSYDDFFLALSRNRATEIQALLDRGFDPNTVNPQGEAAILIAVRQEAWDVAEILASHPATSVDVRNANDETALMLAALKGRLGLCQKLIARDADLNKTGWTPLHYAATNGDPALIRLMLDHYAYIDAESPNGTTPLMMASMYGSAEGVKTLLDAGADASLKNVRGLSALDFARRAKDASVVEWIASSIRAKKEPGGW